MLKIHPIWQAATTLAAFYVFFLGFQRFRFLHLKHKTQFNWKRHVVWGEIVMGAWLVGIAGGLIMAAMTWPGFLITGMHGLIGLILIPLIIFGLASGIYMDGRKKKRVMLPLFHGINNLVVLILACIELATGWWVFNAFILGN